MTARAAAAGPRFALGLPALLWSLGAAAWLLLAAGAAGMLPPALCLGSAGVTRRAITTLTAAGGAPFLAFQAAGWLLMVAAMTAPTLIAPMRHVTARSFTWRRWPAAAEFGAGFAAVWLLLGLGAGLVGVTIAMASPEARRVTVPVALALAAAWQLSPAKARALRRCAATAPLRASGHGADLDCVIFGLRHGWRCAANCGPLMLASFLAMPALTPMALGFVIAIAERSPWRFPAWWSAVALLALAAANVVLGA